MGDPIRAAFGCFQSPKVATAVARLVPARHGDSAANTPPGCTAKASAGLHPYVLNHIQPAGNMPADALTALAAR